MSLEGSGVRQPDVWESVKSKAEGAFMSSIDVNIRPLSGLAIEVDRTAEGSTVVVCGVGGRAIEDPSGVDMSSEEEVMFPMSEGRDVVRGICIRSKASKEFLSRGGGGG